MQLWLITVNFHDTAPTKSLIDSLSLVENFESVKVGIADNEATKISNIELEKIIDNSEIDIKIFSYIKNLYYWPAAKKVINTIKNIKGSYPDWVLVCNNDITFSDRNFIKILSKIDVKEYPIIAPNIINSKGENLNPFLISPLSRLDRLYWNLYFISFSFSRLMLFIKNFLRAFRFRLNKKNISRKRQIYAAHGSAIIFSSSFFLNGGYFDDNFEMYGEELTIAEIAKKLNIPITYFPELEVIHNEHKSTKMIDKRTLFNLAKKSHRYYQSTYSR
ncbi:MAG: hypothetical protein CMG74_10285 [Candidatus Marinimicrobia bacterium]|nr:hypothetical protein [Candidatus Neomarinimicrobiota bacterium]|tara:strand:+ start:566 stop:1390 length:825 start_codon:yes stop_codon:yes gene_type:complete